MLTYDKLTVAQEKWLNLLQHYFEDVYNQGIITYAQLNEVHNKFLELRATDKRFKVGFPVWLQTNNGISPGVYKLPKPGETHPNALSDLEIRLNQELRAFGIEDVDGSGHLRFMTST